MGHADRASRYGPWKQTFIFLYTVSKNAPPLICYNFDIRECILIFFGRNVTDTSSNQKTLYCATPNNLCFRTTWQNGETRKSHFLTQMLYMYEFIARIQLVPPWFLQSFWLTTHTHVLYDSLNLVLWTTHWRTIHRRTFHRGLITGRLFTGRTIHRRKFHRRTDCSPIS